MRESRFSDQSSILYIIHSQVYPLQPGHTIMPRCPYHRPPNLHRYPTLLPRDQISKSQSTTSTLNPTEP